MDAPPRSSSSSPPPMADDMIRLNWTRNSPFNTIISSEDNGIMYEVSTPNNFINHVTTITRLDKASGEKVFAGEIAWKAIRSRTQVRIGWQNCEWTLVQEWLNDPNCKGISTAKTFTGAQGAKYRWKLRNLKRHLTSAENPSEGRSPSLAIFRCPFMKGAWLDVSESVIDSLDYILVALLILEKIRRE
ncbi:hypothetical protein M407DRAFT_20102 [Tulasnella calospora MUT 4182]|uniref:DUF6593 domain-containing protein n=1 Tax=Tulasnella calospora MUT 4182 TaxID=1051891 RepID=A0A0C3MAR5_9AGAM|nr:hypothetical protein M407DRAFT_20102 [Tulasnella calospora MUT 4182]